jgi:hypothetical protein
MNERRPPGRQLSTFSIELLRLSQPHADVATFRGYLETLGTRYHRRSIENRLRALADGGYLHTQGLPRTGWLTDKGAAALKRHS